MATAKEIKVGVKVRPIKNSNSHNYTIGKVYVVSTGVGAGSAGCFTAIDPENPSFSGNNLRPGDVQIVNHDAEHYKNQINHFKAEIKKCETILDWMQETGCTEYDENEFRVWTALSAIEDPALSKIDKTRIIAGLLK